MKIEYTFEHLPTKNLHYATYEIEQIERMSLKKLTVLASEEYRIVSRVICWEQGECKVILKEVEDERQEN
jgi:hypothetical protein